MTIGKHACQWPTFSWGMVWALNGTKRRWRKWLSHNTTGCGQDLHGQGRRLQPRPHHWSLKGVRNSPSVKSPWGVRSTQPRQLVVTTFKSLEAGYWPVVLVGWIVPLGSLSKVYGLSSVSMSSIFLYQVPWYRLHWQGPDRRRLHRAGVARCFWKVSGGPGSLCSGEQEGHCRKRQHRTSCAVERQQNLNSEPWRLPMRGWVRGKAPDIFCNGRPQTAAPQRKEKTRIPGGEVRFDS